MGHRCAEVARAQPARGRWRQLLQEDRVGVLACGERGEIIEVGAADREVHRQHPDLRG